MNSLCFVWSINYTFTCTWKHFSFILKKGAIIIIYSIFNIRKWTNDLSPLKCRMFELDTFSSFIFCLDSGTTCESPWYVQFVWCLYNLNNAVSLTVSLSYYTLLSVGKSHLMHVYMQAFYVIHVYLNIHVKLFDRIASHDFKFPINIYALSPSPPTFYKLEQENHRSL